ncbi:zinc finger protein 805-like isoform X2 [Toxorhynchites rutilus septentrionalis]|nr:zinc finger protein 805-like isoform X2 [Toxorhynchites rutilus septentrionalis]
MCLLPSDELGSIETESPEELKRIVENIYKIAKIEITPAGGKIEPLCGSCRAKLGYDFDEDAYYEMLSKMYRETSPSGPQVVTLGNAIPLHIGLSPPENFDSPGSPLLLDTACGTFVVTELGRDDESAEKTSDLKCIICSKVFNFKSTLRLHIRSHHNTAIREPEPHKQSRKPRLYECGECNLSFKLKYDYDKHQSMHNRSNLFQCEVCYKLFKHKSYYLMHRNAKRCKALPLNLSTDSVGTVSSGKGQEMNSLNGGIRNIS